jgi:hypothetical protein
MAPVEDGCLSGCELHVVIRRYTNLKSKTRYASETIMADLDAGVENNAVHIQDRRIWAEIYYLDSPTDYREYMAQGSIQLRESSLVLLCYKKGAPQKGQPESCRSRTLAMVCRRVAMEHGLSRFMRTG